MTAWLTGARRASGFSFTNSDFERGATAGRLLYWPTH